MQAVVGWMCLAVSSSGVSICTVELENQGRVPAFVGDPFRAASPDDVIANESDVIFSSSVLDSIAHS
jgi:hypothetical protein